MEGMTEQERRERLRRLLAGRAAAATKPGDQAAAEPAGGGAALPGGGAGGGRLGALGQRLRQGMGAGARAGGQGGGQAGGVGDRPLLRQFLAARQNRQPGDGAEPRPLGAAAGDVEAQRAFLRERIRMLQARLDELDAVAVEDATIIEGDGVPPKP